MSKLEFEKILLSNDIFEREKLFLIEEYSDLESLYYSLPTDKILKFCYLYKIRSHKILYESQETFLIKSGKYHLNDYFYLSSLIEDNLNIINYSFDFDLIKEINSNNKKEQRPLRKIINSKIILVLIHNFINEKTEEEETLEMISIIETENKDNINNNITIFHDLNLNEFDLSKIEDTKIGSLYFDIIKSLIRKNEFEDYEYSYNIINQLDLENISIAKPIFVELSKFLNSNETFLNFYKIKKIENLFNKKIINFYFILFKYIFKREILLYEIPWLLEVKLIIINAIKKEEKILFISNLNDKDLNERKEFILKFITDSLYYYNKYLNTKLTIILKYYQNFHFETKIDDIKSIQEFIRTKKGNYEKYFDEIDIAYKMNDRYKIIKLINDLKYKDEKKESNLQESRKIWENLEKLINDKNIDQIELEYKNILKIFFKEENNKNILLKIFNQDIYDFFLNQFSKEILINNKDKKDIVPEKKETGEIISNLEILEDKETKNGNDIIKNIDISNERLQIINYLFNNEDKDKANDKDNDNNIQKIKFWNEIEKNIKNKKIDKIKKFIIEKLIIYFKDEKNKEIISKIFTPETIIFLNNYNDRKSDNIKFTEILKYYKQYFPETKKNDVNLIEEIINNIFKNNIKYGNYEQYLLDYEEAKKMNIRAPIIKFLIDPKNEGIPITEEIIQKKNIEWNDIEKMLKERRLKKMRKNLKIDLKSYFENNENTWVLLKIFKKEDIDYIIKNIYGPKDNIVDKDKDDEKNKNTKKNKKIIQNNKINNIQNNANNNSELVNYGTTKTRTEGTMGTFMDGKDTIKEIKTENNANLKEEGNNMIIEKENIINTKKSKIEVTPNTKEKEKDIIKSDIIKEEKDILYKQIKNITKKILKKSVIKIIDFKKDGKNYIELDKIKYGERLSQLNIRKWDKIIKEYKILCEKDNEIFNNFKKYTEYLDGIKNEIQNKFSLDYKLEIELNFENINNKQNNEIYNITCEYIFYPPLEDSKQLSFSDTSNILTYNTNEFPESFQDLLKEINNENYKIDSNLNSESKKIEDSFQQNSPSDKTSFLVINDSEDNNKYKIITYKRIIGRHIAETNNYTAEFIKELSNHFYISGGTDKKLIIYDKEFKEIKTIEDIKEWTYSITERKTNIANTLQILASSNKDLFIIDLKYGGEIEYHLQKYEFPNMTNVCCIEMANEDYVTVGLYSSYYFINLFSEKNEKVNHKIIVKDKTFRPAIRIQKNILALASNKVAVDGEDKLFFYNSNNKKSSNDIKNRSFNFTVNGLSLIQIGNKNSPDRLLLCACKKYFSDQKNGILLVNPEIKYNHQIDDPFYDTDYFEVYCFCPISICKDTKMTDSIKEDTNIINAFFFVGGFDNQKREGKIRLYRVLNSDNIFKTKIEYLQDIEFYKNDENNKKRKITFEGPISCIIQSKEQENILATCYDGNVYLFSCPNVSFYDKNEEENVEKKEIIVL